MLYTSPFNPSPPEENTGLEILFSLIVSHRTNLLGSQNMLHEASPSPLAIVAVQRQVCMTTTTLRDAGKIGYRVESLLRRQPASRCDSASVWPSIGNIS